MTPSNNDNSGGAPPPFHIRDCALVRLSTGFRARNLRELKDGIAQVHADSIYHHFWGRLLQPQFDEPEFLNDFASWVRHGLHERTLSEKLAVITPTDYANIEELRSELVDVIEAHLDEYDYPVWAKSDQEFHFLRSRLIVLDTGRVVEHPDELGKALADIPLGGVFYHFIDARRRREERCDDICYWLQEYGDTYDNLRRAILAVDPYFSSLKALRYRLGEILKRIGMEVADV